MKTSIRKAWTGELPLSCPPTEEGEPSALVPELLHLLHYPADYYTPEPLLHPDDQSPDFKVYVHTLAQHTAHGAGAFAMSALKRMTGTDSFKQLPEKQKNCRVHNRENCETKLFLDEVGSKCEVVRS